MHLSKLLLASCLLLLMTTYTHAQITICRLTYAYLDKETGLLASIHDVATYSFAAEDEEIMKSFYHAESNTNITVAAQIYGSVDKHEKRHLEVAIAFGETKFKVEDLFRYAESAVAESVYDKADNWLSVSRTRETTKRIYRFRFGCARENRK